MFLNKTSIGLFLLLIPFWFTSQIKLDWEMIHAQSGEKIHIGEKGLVQEVLFSKGFLPDPFYGDNEKEYLWIENYQWVFLSEFEMQIDTLKGNKIELDFPVVDTYAEVYINGVLVGETDNCFHPFQFFIQDFLQNGKNIIKLVFTPPILKLADSYLKADYPLPAPNDVGGMPVSPYCRKPPYQFGWDWTLRMNTIGLWKPAKIYTYEDARYLSCHVETINISDTLADLRVDLFFSDTLEQNRTFSSEYLGIHELEKGQKSFTFTTQIKNPNLWWPKELGTPFLYHDVLKIKNSIGNIEICDTLKFGIRKSELRMPYDQWGQGYEIYINDCPFFCKGANIIPQDIFPTRIDKKRIEDLVHDAVRSNMNMLRVWGGGYYPDDYFYQLCDENGILIWQDLMFACAFYKADSIFMNQVESELNFQIPRISAHPSVVLFNGNNEIEVAWKNWGLQQSYNLNQKAQDQIWKDYQFIFQEFIPNVKNQFSSIPYIHTSPLSNWGKFSDFNYGSQHYWGLWHGNDSLKLIEEKIGRFNAEYGFQSFPEYSTLLSFCDSSDWNLESTAMKSHQKSYVGSKKIGHYSDQLWGKTDDFISFVYLSQLTQAEIIGRSITAHRLDYPRCMGTLYWQFNDCWPAPTWSGIDYFGNWKALQYRVQQEFEQMTVLRYEKDEKVDFYLSITNSLLRNVHLAYVCKDLEGKILSKGNFEIDSFTHEVKLNDYLNFTYHQPYVFNISWVGENGSGSRDFLENYLVSDEIETKVSIKLKHIDEEGGKASLILKNDRFLPYCWILSKNVGVNFDENFKHLLPGKHKMNITFKELLSSEDFNCIWLKDGSFTEK